MSDDESVDDDIGQHAVTFESAQRANISNGELWVYYTTMGGLRP